MNTEALAPQLLLDEQIAYVQSLISEIYPAGIPAKHYALGTPREYILEHSAPAYIADLLADRTAYRLLVAEQLRGLLKQPIHPETADEYADGFNASTIHARELVRAAAKALDIAL